MRTSILGICFDSVTLSQAAEAADGLLLAGRGGTIVTANPEIVLRCREDEAYRSVVNAADLVLADGVGDLLAGRILRTPLPERVTGADLTPLLLERLAGRGGSVFLYGGKPGVADRAGARIAAAYPGLRIAGTENGYISRETELLRRLEEAKPDLLLLGLGAPRQERWMAEHRESLPSVMIGVGGLLDVLAGDLPRAPERWRKAGLEWLFRLLREPRRIRRVAMLPRILVLAGAERIKNGARKGPAEDR